MDILKTYYIIIHTKTKEENKWKHYWNTKGIL